MIPEHKANFLKARFFGYSLRKNNKKKKSKAILAVPKWALFLRIAYQCHRVLSPANGDIKNTHKPIPDTSRFWLSRAPFPFCPSRRAPSWWAWMGPTSSVGTHQEDEVMRNGDTSYPLTSMMNWAKLLIIVNKWKQANLSDFHPSRFSLVFLWLSPPSLTRPVR